MAKNANLHEAKVAKNDEFYTDYRDIESELTHYRNHFRDKVVFCNCDDPTYSNFWEYFHRNFELLGLKKLISTHYEAGPVQTYKLEYMGGDDLNIEEGIKTPLEANGDFRSPECVALLDECDIVCTNEPFSLFREYVELLMEHGKKFLIIGNKNAITYKEFFPLLKENKVWIGYSSPSEFDTPNGMTKKINGLTRWFTNLDIPKRHYDLETVFRYGEKDELYPDLYPKYDNYDAVNVDKVSQIPLDYYESWSVLESALNERSDKEQWIVSRKNVSDGVTYCWVYPSERNLLHGAYAEHRDNYREQIEVALGCVNDYCSGIMGVPITFMDKYNPEQFEIVGMDLNNSVEELGIKEIGNEWVELYKKQGGKGHITASMHSLVYTHNGKAVSLYRRVLIRRLVTN